jgi:hypothetical protein
MEPGHISERLMVHAFRNKLHLTAQVTLKASTCVTENGQSKIPDLDAADDRVFDQMPQ